MPKDPLKILELAKDWPGVLLVSYGSGELIFPEGGFAIGVYLVERGLVGLFPSATSQKPGLYLARPGEFLGLEAWLSAERPRYQAAARALTKTQLLFFPPAVWEKALEDKEFRKLVFASLGDMWRRFLTEKFSKADTQNAVLWAFQEFGEETSQGFSLPLSPGLLAQALGISRTKLKQALASLGVAQDGDFLVLPKKPALTGSPQ
jgi:CRP-like cAMP-binding protein